MDLMSHQPRRAEGITPDNYPSVEQQPLSPRELDALAYWKRFLPETSKALEAQGPNALPTEIRKASHRLEYLMALEQAKNPDLPADMALEAFRTELYPPPEAAANPDRDL